MVVSVGTTEVDVWLVEVVVSVGTVTVYAGVVKVVLPVRMQKHEGQSHPIGVRFAWVKPAGQRQIGRVQKVPQVGRVTGV